MGFFEEQEQHKQKVARHSAQSGIGIVSSVRLDPQIGPVARLTFPDQDGKVSAEWPILQKNTVGTASYNLPRVGERVYYSRFGNGFESGVIHGSVYSSAVSTPPQGDPNDHQTTFDDGSTETISPKNSSYNLSMLGPIEMLAGTTIKFTANGQITVTTGADMVVNTSGNLTATVGGNFTLNASGSATLKASSITLDAPTVNCTGIFHGDTFEAYQAGFPTATPHMHNSDGTSTDES